MEQEASAYSYIIPLCLVSLSVVFDLSCITRQVSITV